MLLGEGGEVVCGGCEGVTEVSAAGSLAVGAIAEGESGGWFMHDAVVKYARASEEELPEMRRAWGVARRRLREDPEDDDVAEQLLSLTVAISFVIPYGPERDLALRALYEASAEAFVDGGRRQQMLGNLASGAARSGDVESAKEWLRHLRSDAGSGYADTVYRCSVATVATAEGDWEAVLEALPDDLVVHPARGNVAASLRANAYEELGRAKRADEVVRDYVRTDPSALGHMVRIATSPSGWRPAEAAVQRVAPRELFRRVRRNHTTTVLALVVIFVVVLSNYITLRSTVVTVAVVAVASAWWLRDHVRLRRLVHGAVLVQGRVTRASRPTGGWTNAAALVHPHDREPVTVSFLTPLAVDDVEGQTFDAFWNPQQPERVFNVVFKLSRGATKRLRPSAEDRIFVRRIGDE